MFFSNRIIQLKESPIRKLMPTAIKALDFGKKIYYLNIGQPDIQTPNSFFDAINNFQMHTLKYAHSRGNHDLIKEVISYYHTFNIHLKTNNIIVTNGASEAISFAISVICNPSDEVLLPEPYYVNTANFIDQLAVKVKPIPTQEANGYHLPSKDKIESLINEKTKAILVTHPNNPTGTVYTDDELNMLKDIAIKHDLFIISDEVYKTITFDGLIASSFGTISEELDQRLILIDSVSKRYSACGARIGTLISKNEQFMKYAMKLAEARLSVSTIDQIASIELYKMDKTYYKDIAKEYEKRRNAVLKALKAIPDIGFSHPEGAFYILVTLPIENAEHFAKWLLESFDYNNETVFVAPAKDFYLESNQGKNKIRIAYVYEENILTHAIDILHKGLDKYLTEY